MLVRYVRMTFQEEKVPEFLHIFNGSKEQIRAMPGCSYLELMQDLNQPNIFMTHSHWECEEALNNYRQTALFKTVWAHTKALFADSPLAFSVESVMVV
ncbi:MULTISPECIES: putative quinol monooxygenase [Emticicia]|uniref:putative quinol monooxygenase n=1 Tax=Emticicia TaxID=312278 RepID=UPI00209EEB01|nr:MULTISPECIES: antibiotic biosynthesis monooxygenase [Emticicia]UTA70408.1 antibiotic biosynthesis monooxygenase [Emticicia sp. 21SJ11W-3]